MTASSETKIDSYILCPKAIRPCARIDYLVSPDYWQQIEALFHAAMERDRTERDAFLDQACVGDEVRREVESLIAQATARTNLLDRPAWALDEGLSAAISTHIPLTPGMQIGHTRLENGWALAEWVRNGRGKMVVSSAIRTWTSARRRANFRFS